MVTKKPSAAANALNRYVATTMRHVTTRVQLPSG